MSNVKAFKTAEAASKLNIYEEYGGLRTYTFVSIRDPQAPYGFCTRRVNVSTDWHADQEMARRRMQELRDANPDIRITGRLTVDYL